MNIKPEAQTELVYAQRTIWHYFDLIAKKQGVILESDCHTEICDAVQSIFKAAVIQLEKEPSQ